MNRNLVNTQNNVDCRRAQERKKNKQTKARMLVRTRHWIVCACVHQPFLHHLSRTHFKLPSPLPNSGLYVYVVGLATQRQNNYYGHTQKLPLAIYGLRVSTSYCNLWRSGHEASHSGTHGPAFPTNGDSQSSRSTISFWPWRQGD